MSRRRATVTLVVSLLALVGVAVVAVSGAGGEPRADLVGAPVTQPERSTTTSALAPSPSEPAPAAPLVGVPTGLAIPSLEVLAPVVPVGLEDDGAMEVPGASDAGWYRYGVAPGNLAGSAVIAAHVDYDDRPGVFLELARLELGAEVAVSDEHGQLHRYVVSERFQVDKELLPVGELFRSDGEHVLTLITCGGSFDRSDRSYADNIVIRATPI